MVAAALSVLSCTNEDDVPNLPEIVRGTVALHDEFGNDIDLVDSVSMLITHDGGETYAAIPMLDGDFLIEIRGDWTFFQISRPSFGTREILDLDVDYLQGRTIRLSEQSPMQISDLEVTKADCGDLPCVDLSFQVENYLIGTDAKRFFELDMLVGDNLLGTTRFFGFQASEPGMTVTPLEGNTARLSFESLSAVALGDVFGQEVRFRVYGATHNRFHQDFTIDEIDNSRNAAFGEVTLAY